MKNKKDYIDVGIIIDERNMGRVNIGVKDLSVINSNLIFNRPVNISINNTTYEVLYIHKYNNNDIELHLRSLMNSFEGDTISIMKI